MPKLNKRKLSSIWSLLRAEYYAVLLADSDQEIAWAVETLRKADDNLKAEASK